MMWVRSEMVIFGSNHKTILFYVTPQYLISPTQNQDAIKIPIFPLEWYKDYIYTLTPTRMNFLAWIQKQLKGMLVRCSSDAHNFAEENKMA